MEQTLWGNTDLIAEISASELSVKNIFGWKLFERMPCKSWKPLEYTSYVWPLVIIMPRGTAPAAHGAITNVIECCSESQALVLSTKHTSSENRSAWPLAIIGVTIATANGSSENNTSVPVSLYTACFSLSFWNNKLLTLQYVTKVFGKKLNAQYCGLRKVYLNYLS